ncbi:MAG: hypothetical protein LBE34_05010 [Flavobacteriaceae bacterium]|jgi:hypothetical protein|nr:hypothetical protein [Flavobacteriaceae bacterium]
MKFPPLNTIQKIYLSLLVLLISTNLYYALDFNSQIPILNPSVLLYSTQQEKGSIMIDQYEVHEIRTEASLFEQDNLWGITHRITLQTQPTTSIVANSHNSIAEKQDYTIKKYLTSIDNDRAILRIPTSYFSSREIELVDSANQHILIKTNPFKIVNNDLFQIIALIVCLLIACTFVISCVPGSALFAFTLYGILLLISNYLYTFILLSFIHVSLFRIKMVHIADIVDYTFNRRKLIFSVSFILFFVSIFFLQGKSINISSLLFCLLGSTALSIGSFFVVYFICNTFKTFYILFKFPSQEVNQLSATNLKDGIDKSTYTKQMPHYTGDITLNNTIKLTLVDLDPVIYKKFKNGKAVTSLVYKTDGKGNYIFFS